MIVYCENSRAVSNSKEPRSHQRGKHIKRKFHLIKEIVEHGDVTVCKIKSEDNLENTFTKTPSSSVFGVTKRDWEFETCHGCFKASGRLLG